MSLNDKKATCRTCLESAECLESMEEENDVGISIKDMLLSFCTIQLDEQDASVFNVICKECSLEILRAYNFKLKCEQNDFVFRERLQTLKTEKPLSDSDVVTKQEPGDIKQECELLVDLYDVNIKQELDYQDEDDGAQSSGVEYREEKRRKVKQKKLKKRSTSKTSDSAQTLRKAKRRCVEKESSREEIPKSSGGKPGRKKKIRPDSEKIFVDDSSAALGYKKIFECHKCHAFFKTFRMLYKHQMKVHCIALQGVEEYNTVWENLKQKEDVKSEVDVKELNFQNPRYKCLDCSLMSKSFDTLRKHIISAHRGERYIECDECEYNTTHLTMLVRHKRTHTGERRFPCPQCPYRSVSNYQLNLHITVMHTQQKSFVCDVCAQAFKTKISLHNHITRKHLNRREHKCSICGKGFNMKKDLKHHILIHTGQKPHVCEHCGMAFTQKTNLEKHVRIIHLNAGERPHPCPECDYRAKDIYCLKSHISKHNRTEHFPCHLCNHKATTKYALKVHVQRHLGVKRFQCKSCVYSCYDAQTLVVHNRIHTGERPYPCQLCPYRSRTKQRLYNHMKSHLNEQKFSCQHCPYRSNYKANLVVHLKKNCGRDSRPYTPRKNQMAISFSDEGDLPASSSNPEIRGSALQLGPGGMDGDVKDADTLNMR